MAAIDKVEMKKEMEEMAILLKEIQGGARELSGPSVEKQSRYQYHYMDNFVIIIISIIVSN
jgi:hypothetical protein